MGKTQKGGKRKMNEEKKIEVRCDDCMFTCSDIVITVGTPIVIQIKFIPQMSKIMDTMYLSKYNIDDLIKALKKAKGWIENE